MAIVLDSTSSVNSTESGITSLTFSHTVNSNTNGILIVVVSMVDPNRMSGVTYAGDAMTKVIERNDADYRNCSIWRLVAPDTGANDVVLSFSSSTRTVKAYAASFTGVDQTSPIGASNSNTSATSSAQTVAITTTRNNSVIISVDSVSGDVGVAPHGEGDGQTNIAAVMTGNAHGAGATYEFKTPAGADTQTWANAREAWSMASAEIKESPTLTTDLVSYWKLDGNSYDAVGGGPQDFTGYTEVDPASRLTVTLDTVTFADLHRTDGVTYISKDFGAGFFSGNFKHRFRFKVTSFEQYGGGWLWRLCADPASQTNGDLEISTGYPSSGNYRMQLAEDGHDGDNWDTADTPSYAVNTDYYVEVERSGSTLTAKYYSDAYSTLVETLTVTLNAVTSLRYLALATNIVGVDTVAWNGFVKDLTLGNNGTDTDISYTLIDSYDPGSYSNNSFITIPYGGQSFWSYSASQISSVKGKFVKDGTPVGSLYAKIYSHTGTFGTSGKPGTLLATSDAFDTTGFTDGYATLTFSGANIITTNANTPYIIVFYGTGFTAGNLLYWHVDITDVTAPGNSCNSTDGSTWTASDTQDTPFYVYGTNNGKINQGAGFNGTTSNIRISDRTWGIANAFTISYWLKKNDTGNQSVFVLQETSGNENYVNFNLYGDKLVCGINKSDGSTYIKDYVGATELSSGTWYHAVATWDGTDLEIYLNGEKDTPYYKPADTTGSMTNTSRILTIGADKDGSGPYTGSIDEVGIWSRALTSGEVTSLYNGGSGLAYPLEDSGITIIVSESPSFTEIFLGNMDSKNSENVEFTETMSVAKAIYIALSEAINFTETISSLRSLVISVSESINFTDTMTALWNLMTKKLKSTIKGTLSVKSKIQNIILKSKLK
jgi:hypothetical protein